MATIPQLPNEIVEAILLRIPVLYNSNESVRTLCRVGQVTSRFLAVSRLPHIWQRHYTVRWTRCEITREEKRKTFTHENWRDMYVTRSRIDSRALELLDCLMAHQDGRDAIAVELTTDLGYDAWQALSGQTAQIHYQQITDKDTHDMIDLPIEGLTRQYWSREVLGVIARIRAIDLWKHAVGPREEDISFEQGLAGLSAFFGQDIEKIFEEFDRLAGRCRAHLTNLGLSKSLDTAEAIVQICAWMRQEGFVKTDLTNYFHLLNNFPHRVLFEQSSTLPISLVYVFVSIARRLGLDASPVAFPHRVLAVVLPPAGQQGERIYVDVFESDIRPILSYTSDLPAMLEQIGVPTSSGLQRHTAPASTGVMLLRSAANIIHALERVMTWSESDQMAAHYAAYCAALLLTNEPRFVRPLFVPGVGGPLDRKVVFERALGPNLAPRAREELDRHLTMWKDAQTDGGDPRNMRRNVLYFTGMIFRHRKYSYIGLIKAWDYQCEAGDDWAYSMNVHGLPRGSDQPFYQSFTPDGHTRYVAEENIQPIGRPTPSDIHALIEANKDIGRWFDGVEFGASGAGRFVMSSEARTLYPEDDGVARAFMVEYSKCLTPTGLAQQPL